MGKGRRMRESADQLRTTRFVLPHSSQVSMVQGDLPQSQQAVGSNRIALPTPDGGTVYYPVQLGLMGRDHRKYSIFIAHNTISGTSFIATTGTTAVKFRMGVASNKVSDVYDNAPFPENVIMDEQGAFYYKEVPQGFNLDEYFKI